MEKLDGVEAMIKRAAPQNLQTLWIVSTAPRHLAPRIRPTQSRPVRLRTADRQRLPPVSVSMPIRIS